MELTEIERHAKALMTAHGVGSLEFKFDGAKRRLGACLFQPCKSLNGTYWLPKQISLSKHYAVLLPAEELHDVILHEIAHALAGRNAGHGPLWKAAARKVGAKAQRCATPSASPQTSVAGVCTNPDCQKVVSNLHRLPQRVSFHRNCGRDFPLRWFKNGAMVRFNDMPAKYRDEYSRNYGRNVQR